MATDREPALTRFIRSVCGELPEAEQKEAEENFRGYIEIVLRISERIAKEQEHKK